MKSNNLSLIIIIPFSILVLATIQCARVSPTSKVDETSQLVGCDLTDAYLGGVSLRHANFNGAILRSTNFREANLSGAIFYSAILSGSDLSSANLYGSDLRLSLIHI